MLYQFAKLVKIKDYDVLFCNDGFCCIGSSLYYSHVGKVGCY
nr:MAG TPA: hypothetical protein [Bacteriophage sp.]